jgi:hypothetical protein
MLPLLQWRLPIDSLCAHSTRLFVNRTQASNMSAVSGKNVLNEIKPNVPSEVLSEKPDDAAKVSTTPISQVETGSPNEKIVQDSTTATIDATADRHVVGTPQKTLCTKESILATLNSSASLPSKAEFERQWSQALRFDRDIFLALCNRADFLQLFNDRHLFVPDCLKADKQVMIAYCKTVPRSLQECSDELTDDRDVVEAAVQRSGSELQYASLRLQQEKEKCCRGLHELWPCSGTLSTR